MIKLVIETRITLEELVELERAACSGREPILFRGLEIFVISISTEMEGAVVCARITERSSPPTAFGRIAGGKI